MEPAARADRIESLATGLRARLLDATLAGAAAGSGDGSAETAIRAAVDAEAGALSPATRAQVAERAVQQALGLGPLEPLLRESGVDEVLVSGTKPIWIERGGRLEPTSAAFSSEDELRDAIERLLARAGRRADEAEPICDARLPDGSRVNVVLPPLAVDGPALTIRRFRPRGLSGADLVRLGTWTEQLAELLGAAVRARLNVLVCGATGSGKTTTLGALVGMAGGAERIVTIEDTAELRLDLPHVVRLEARPASAEGRGEVTIRALVRNALRMRPDRILVGEVRGPEAHDMLAALATGHDGSLSTIHAGSAAEALRRLETLALTAGVGLSHAAVSAQVCDAFDLVVHQVRRPGGERVVVETAEVVRVAGVAAVRPLYVLRGQRPVRRPAASERVAAALGER